jgi:RNA 3'-terminal phosphate cyclase
MGDAVHVDGAQGEGGGQLFRAAVGGGLTNEIAGREAVQALGRLAAADHSASIEETDFHADDAVDEPRAYLDSPGAIDWSAADQILLLAALCPERSDLLVQRRTGHLVANAAVIEQLTQRRVDNEDTPDGAARVHVAPTQTK